jgi:hypothetical protein
MSAIVGMPTHADATGKGRTTSIPSYTITALPPPAGAQPLPTVTALSNDGDVAGFATFYDGENPYFDAVIWHDGTPTDVSSEVHGGTINGLGPTGEIVGDCPLEACTFRVENNQYQQIKGLADALAVNAAGKIVGDAGVAFLHAAAWSHGVVTKLRGAKAYTWADAVNSEGDVAGAITHANRIGEANQPAFWRNGQLKDLEPAGECDGQSNDLNDNDEVVGYFDANNDCSGEQQQAFLWAKGVLTNLNPLTGMQFSDANSINSQGAVVGNAFDELSPSYAWIYQGGKLTYLDNLLPAKSKWSISFAMAINDSGQILGFGAYGNTEEDLIMTPTGNDKRTAGTESEVDLGPQSTERSGRRTNAGGEPIRNVLNPVRGYSGREAQDPA